MTGWEMTTPKAEETPKPPPYSADNYPLGTRATRDGHPSWVVGWDDQDKRHMWVRVED